MLWTICVILYNFVVAGIGQRLHDGWSHSHPPGHRHRGGAGPRYSGTKTLIAVLTLAGEGEIFGKEVVGRPRKILSNRRCLQEKEFYNHPFHYQLRKGVTAMKKIEIFIRYFVILMLIATFAACASTPKQEGAGEYVDDSVITTKVKTLLAADDFLKSFQIGVETFKGTVQLSGFVNSQKAVDKAGEITRSVKGVKSVKNDLIMK